MDASRKASSALMLKDVLLQFGGTESISLKNSMGVTTPTFILNIPGTALNVWQIRSCFILVYIEKELLPFTPKTEQKGLPVITKLWFLWNIKVS